MNLLNSSIVSSFQSKSLIVSYVSLILFCMLFTILLGAEVGVGLFLISLGLVFLLLKRNHPDVYRSASLQLLFVSSSVIPMLQFNFLAFFSSSIGSLERAVILGFKFIPLFLILYTILITYTEKIKLIVVPVVFVLVYGFAYPVDYFQVKLTYLLNSFLPFFALQILALSLLTSQSTNVLFLNDFKARFEGAVSVFITLFCWLLPLAVIFYATGWELFDYSSLIELKGYEAYKGVPLNWYSQFGNGFIIRFTHLFEDPILLGYLLAFIAVYLFVRGELFACVIFILLMLLTLTKGALLWLVLTLFFIGLKRFGVNNRLLLMSSYLFFLVLMSMISFKTSLGVHVDGLISPFLNSSQYTLAEFLFGHGIGSGGNLLKAYLGGEIPYSLWLDSGAESGLGSLMFQTGFFGLLVFFTLIYQILGVLRSQLSIGLYLGYVFNFLLQENLLNFSYISLLILLILYIELSLQKECLNGSV